jgi:hypothetical protein
LIIINKEDEAKGHGPAIGYSMFADSSESRHMRCAMSPYQRLLQGVLTLLAIFSLAFPNLALSYQRMATTNRIPLRIVLDRSDIKIGPGETVNVRARVLDRFDNPIPQAQITWTIPRSQRDILHLKRLDAIGSTVVISRNTTEAATANVKIRAESAGATISLDVNLQGLQPVEVIFPDGNPIDLPAGGKKIVRAYALDARGNRVRNAEISWRLANPNFEAFVYLGRATNSPDLNSVELLWRPGTAEVPAPEEVQVIATAGETLGLLTVKYKSSAAENYTISFDNKNKKELRIGPGDSDAVQVTVRGDKEKIVDVKPTAEIADENSRKFIRVVVGPDKKTITVFGLYGDDAKLTPDSIYTALVVHAAGAAITIPLIYQRDSAVVVWDILPPKIVGDNYGRTIKNDYYCIEVAIQNNSGSDLALAGLRFKGAVMRPNTSYTTVHGSLAKRKLTHPRALTLAIVDSMGSLLTGFNPFFHNINHAKNYSQFIDILSNPFAKGLEKAWKDTYPDELVRFEQDVLRDDKIIPNASIFKTKIFVPKRVLFTKKQKEEREDLNEVRKALGELWVLGYKFQKGQVQNIATAP